MLLLNLEKVRLECKETIIYAKEEIEKFSTRFAKNPVYTIEWSGSVFEDTARLKVYLAIEQMLNFMPEGKKPSDVERSTHIVKEVRREVFRQARSPEHSTSIPSNLFSRCELSAWAKALEWLEGRVVNHIDGVQI